MERQLKNQMSDLANMEDRVSKSAAEVCIPSKHRRRLMLMIPK